MSILDKFSAVEIKTDSRISEEDRNFCQVHEKAYLAARKELISLKTRWSALYNYQTALMESVSESEYTRERYIRIEGLSISSLSGKVELLPDLFITSLVIYFNDKYHVSVKAEEIKKVLLPEAPKSDWKKSRSKEYHEKMELLTLHYEDVVEQIFVQLGGRTFEQRAIDELKEKCHAFAWSTYNKGEPQYEIQNQTIRFNRYACRYRSLYDEWEIENGMKDVLKGLAHFETQQLDYVPKDIAFLIGHQDKRSSTYEFNYEKIKKFRMFKNNHVDVKFASKELAHQFAEQYLGLVA